MTDPYLEGIMAKIPTDPAAVDLERASRIADAMERFSGVPSKGSADAALVRAFIAEVEALRERVAATEAREVELAGALGWLAEHGNSIRADLKSAHLARADAASKWMREDDKELRAGFANAINKARTALAATPAEALERAKAKDEFVDICHEFVRRVEAGEIRSRRTYAQCVNALAKLDALDSPAQEDTDP